MKNLAWFIGIVLLMLGFLSCEKDKKDAVLQIKNLSSQNIDVIINHTETHQIAKSAVWVANYSSDQSVHVQYSGLHVFPDSTDVDVTIGETSVLDIPATAGSITVMNNGDASLYSIYIVPNNSTNWGDNLLQEELMPLHSITWTKSAGEYQIKMVDKYNHPNMYFSIPLSVDQNQTVYWSGNK